MKWKLELPRERSAEVKGNAAIAALRPSGALRTAHALALAYIVLAGGLIALLAFDQDFTFLGVGWILVFVLVSLLPWLLPLAAP